MLACRCTVCTYRTSTIDPGIASTLQTRRGDEHHALQCTRYWILGSPRKTPHTRNRADTIIVLCLQYVYTIAY